MGLCTWTGAVDAAWDTPGNWVDEVLPQSGMGDSVLFTPSAGPLETGPASAVELVDFNSSYAVDEMFRIAFGATANISVTGELKIGTPNCPALSTLTGQFWHGNANGALSCTFYGNSYNFGVVNNATFEDFSANLGFLCGYPTFTVNAAMWSAILDRYSGAQLFDPADVTFELGPYSFCPNPPFTDVATLDHVRSTATQFGQSGTLNLTNLTAGNIKAGVTIDGVPGAWGPAPAAEVIKKPEVVNGVTGTLDVDNAVADNIKSGVTIAGVTGAYEGEGGGGGLTEEQAAQLAAIKAKTDLIVSGRFTVVAPLSSDGKTLSLVIGDDYYHEEGRAIDFISDDYPDLTGATPTLRILPHNSVEPVFTVEGTIIDSRTIRYEIPTEKTSLLNPSMLGTYKYSNRVTFADEHIATENRGNVLVYVG